MKLEATANGYTIDAEDLGPMLDVSPSDIPALMRSGQITSVFERGQGEDEGRCRITFRLGTTTLRLTLELDGTVLSRRRITSAN